MRVESSAASDQIVRDQQRRCPMRAPELVQQAPHALRQRRIEREQRFVQHQEIRLDQQCPRQCGAPLHAAGELAGQSLFVPAQFDRLQQRARLVRRFRAAHQQQVIEDVEPGNQARLLEHDAEARPGALPRQLSAIPSVKPRDDAQQGRLAGAGRPDKADELAFRDGRVDVVQHHAGRRIVEAARDSTQDQTGHPRRHFPSRRSSGCRRRISIAMTAAMKVSE